MSKDHWFWHSRFMNWVEGTLLDLTNWVWKKRHSTNNNSKQVYKEPASTPAKKSTARKNPAKKKTDWNVK